ncbi:MAG: hypothetical protein PVG41_08950, partial [Desulfobacteraceae bacterium]
EFIIERIFLLAARGWIVGDDHRPFFTPIFCLGLVLFKPQTTPNILMEREILKKAAAFLTNESM